jgi:predicted transcriptional regulator
MIKITGKIIKLMIIIYKPNEKERHILNIAKIANITYSHTLSVIQSFEKEGLIKTKKIGRTRIIEITPKGIMVFSSFEKAYNTLL